MHHEDLLFSQRHVNGGHDDIKSAYTHIRQHAAAHNKIGHPARRLRSRAAPTVSSGGKHGEHGAAPAAPSASAAAASTAPPRLVVAAAAAVAAAVLLLLLLLLAAVLLHALHAASRRASSTSRSLPDGSETLGTPIKRRQSLHIRQKVGQREQSESGRQVK